MGSAVAARLTALGEEVVGVGREDADLVDEGAVRALVDGTAPTHVIHCAAYTNVDGAEKEVDLCDRVNARAPGHLASACAARGASLLYISTDFVFDGTLHRPYREDDPAGPRSVYGRSKLEGEGQVADALERRQIVRTAWLFGPGKRNFVTGILDRLRGSDPITVVEDQVGSPTYTLDLAEGLVSLSRRAAFGVFHLVNAGWCSRLEMARKIADLAGEDPRRIEPIHSDRWPAAAKRPAYSVLDCSKVYALGVEPLRHWTAALGHYVTSLLDAEESLGAEMKDRAMGD